MYNIVSNFFEVVSSFLWRSFVPSFFEELSVCFISLGGSVMFSLGVDWTGWNFILMAFLHWGHNSNTKTVSCYSSYFHFWLDGRTGQDVKEKIYAARFTVGCKNILPTFKVIIFNCVLIVCTYIGLFLREIRQMDKQTDRQNNWQARKTKLAYFEIVP